MEDYQTIGTRLGIDDLSGFVRDDVRAPLSDMPDQLKPNEKDPAIESMKRTMSFAFFGFSFFFAVIAFLVPDTWWSVPMKVILFPTMFIGAIFGTLWLKRATVSKILLKTQGRFITRAKILDKLAKRLGLTYVPSPGGAPESLKILAKMRIVKDITDPIIDLLDRHGGMDDAVSAATNSGLLTADVVVMGNKAQKARYYRQSALGHAFEDGFEGERAGVTFSAFEWIEKVDEAPDKYHLLLVLKAPQRLQGVTQLRSRKTPWPKGLDDPHMGEVQLVPASFNEKFRLRGSDQVEARTIFNPAVVERVLALAHGETFRAVARGDCLVLDIVGENRFNLVDLHTGEWSENHIRQTLTDMAEMLDFVDAAAHAFMVRA